MCIYIYISILCSGVARTFCSGVDRPTFCSGVHRPSHLLTTAPQACAHACTHAPGHFPYRVCL